jgi:glycosyltransferase involved in cell wall biosynthesis
MHPDFLENVLAKYSDIPNVKTTGYVQENAIERIFCDCAAVILPYSISTWSSGVFTLACTYGRPVIASDLKDFRALKDEGAGLILFPKGDKDALIASMLAVVDDKSLQKQMGDLNMNWARSNRFTRVSDQIIEIFNETLVTSLASRKGH